ncbi:hypothetical protein [Spiroplasma alleghenense]|uniref:Uncharacterized protein n=1 Tax=Spiroplasma alleghenense TaxID=216931 RepID=A0A345Z4Z2_9MOLU|nr:hypothetical protein [Spiroplasma alleghenense]AXK51671.1 hypothetical protein SALLE_v1c10010 [Spiroplasma alleghenense]
MRRQINVKNKIMSITIFILSIFILILLFVAHLFIQNKVFIKNIPNIEPDFFNDFDSNGINVYERAYLITNNMVFPFMGMHAYLLSAVAVLAWTLYIVISFKDQSRRPGSIWFGGFCPDIFWVPLFVLFLMSFAFPLNFSIWESKIESQVGEYFGKDFRQDNVLNAQFEYIRIWMKEIYNMALPLNITGVSVSLIIIILIFINKLTYEVIS